MQHWKKSPPALASSSRWRLGFPPRRHPLNPSPSSPPPEGIDKQACWVVDEGGGEVLRCFVPPRRTWMPGRRPRTARRRCLRDRRARRKRWPASSAARAARIRRAVAARSSSAPDLKVRRPPPLLYPPLRSCPSATLVARSGAGGVRVLRFEPWGNPWPVLRPRRRWRACASCSSLEAPLRALLFTPVPDPG